MAKKKKKQQTFSDYTREVLGDDVYIEEPTTKVFRYTPDDDIAPSLRETEFYKNNLSVTSNLNRDTGFLTPSVPYAPLAPDATSDALPYNYAADQAMKRYDEKKWFEKSNYFADGYQFGDVVKSGVASLLDVGNNLLVGLAGLPEKLADAALFLGDAMNASQQMQNMTYQLTADALLNGGENEQDIVDNTLDFLDESQKQTAEWIAQDLYNEQALLDTEYGQWAEKGSVLGEKTDAIAQSGGQMLGVAALQAAGVPWYLTTGASTFGGEMESALNQGATYEEAAISAGISAGAEVLTEQLGGISFGGKAIVDDLATEWIAKTISNKVAGTVLKLGVSASAEGVEEILSSYISAVGQKLTYCSEQELEELFTAEDAWDAFVGGVMLAGTSGTVNTINDVVTGKDTVTGMTKNEQAVFDKVYNDAIAEAEADGTTLTQAQKNEIYNTVLDDLEKGNISTETIEEVLGGESYQTYKDTVDSEEAAIKELSELYEGEELQQAIDDILNNSERGNMQTKLSEEVYGLVKDSRLAESYNQNAQRSRLFEADITQYDTAQRTTIQKAIDSGILNNTRKTHEFVDMLAKISADKGVSFDFTNNEKLKNSGFAVNGKAVNGYVTSGGIVLNMNSRKALNSVVGHEVTHVLEGTEMYDALQEVIFEYANGKKASDSKFESEYKERLYNTRQLYKDVEGYQGVEGFKKIKREVVSDLVGDYIFTNNDFIMNLSTKHRNVFEKIFDEIKYLSKIATAGTKEARDLERAKKAFEEAYRADSKAKADGKVQHSLSYTTDNRAVAVVESDIFDGKFAELSDSERLKIVKDAIKKFRPGVPVSGRLIGVSRKSAGHFANSDYTDKIRNHDQKLYEDKLNVAQNIDDVIYASTDYINEEPKHQRIDNITQFARGTVLLDIGGNKYEANVIVGYTTMNEMLFYDVQDLNTTNFDYKENKAQPKLAGNESDTRKTVVPSDGIIPQSEQDVNTLFSISSDNDGKQLTKEQAEYFKDSKMRDDEGNLMVMYHGSQDAGFHTFDANMSDDGSSFFFVDRNDVAASYSGTSETYEAQTIHTAEDMNKFIESIGVEGYEVVEKDGKFTLLYEGERVADSNTAKGIYDEFCWYEGVGEGDANYKVYLNLKNPLVVDAEGGKWNDLRHWSKSAFVNATDVAVKRVDGEFRLFDKNTNAEVENSAVAVNSYTESLDRNSLLYLMVDKANYSLSINTENLNTTRDVSKFAKEHGYDGVIFKNIHDNGGYSNGSEGASTVAIAFESNQIKSVANEKPTGDKDIRYSLSEDSEGRKLSDNQAMYFNGSKVVDDNGNLKVVYHGSPSDFNTFSLEYLGTNGTNEGYGFYFTDKKSIAEGYSKGREGQQNGDTGKLFEVYLDIKKPLSDKEVTMTRAQFKKLLVALNNRKDADGERLDILSNYGDVEWEGLNKVLNYAMEIEYDGSDSDVNMIHSLINGCGNKEAVFDELRKVAGYDGIIVEEATWGGDQTIYIAFHPEQIKNVGNLNPTSNPDTRYSLSNEGEKPQKRDPHLTYGKDLLLEQDVAPVQNVQDTPHKSDARRAAEYSLEQTKKDAEEFGIDFEYQKMESQAESGNIAQGRDALGRGYTIRKLSNGKYAATCESDNGGLGGFVPNSLEVETDTFDDAYLAIKEHLLENDESTVASILKDYEAASNTTRTTEADVAPVQDSVQDDVAPTVDNIASMAENTDSFAMVGELQTELDQLDSELAVLMERGEEAVHSGDTELVNQIAEQYKETFERAYELRERLSNLESERIASLDDADAPAEMEAPYSESGMTPDDPFADRDMKAVSKDRKVNAYMYENPEVKPFFQEEASFLLGELQNGEKGERFYTETPNGQPGVYGAESYGVWTGVSRNVSPDIEYLLDTVKMSYADIEKGLKAIIEDNGAENIAAAKKIEFVLNDRLMNGYQEWSFGTEVPPNQDYINLLNEKQITEYNEEARKQLFESDDYVPDDIAPVAENKSGKAYEAIRPPKESAEPRMTEAAPRMKRVDSTNNAPDGMEERSWYETSTGSEAVNNTVTPDDIPDEVRYYQVKSNKKTLETANARLARDGYAKSREYFEGRMSDRKLSVEDIALGERLIQEAAKAGDTQAVRDLIIDVSILGTELGQRVQALSIIQRLTPEGQLKALVRTVERGKAKGDKAFDGVEVTEDMTKRILDTYKEDGTFDQAALDDAVEDVKEQIADQMSVSAWDKMNAWRYLSMLGNPKTHVRNIVSNVAMFGTRKVKNAIARTIEDIAPVKTRTKTWKQATEAVKAFARATTEEQESVIKGDNKYSDEGGIKAKRKIFESKVLQPVNVAMNFNTDLMEKEDWIFSKNAYRTTLQEYLTANGIKTEQDIKNNPELVTKAKEYALEEASRATFRQDSYLANKISEIEKKNAVYGVVIGSTMPFKKTPINIAKTGVAYSPLGFARNVYDAVKVGKGEMNASEAIDHLAQTLTGTSLMLIGYALAEAGVLNGAGDDDKEGKYDYQLGEQSYSFNFGGNTYSLNWLSPVSMPLFVGANAYEILVEKTEWDANVVIDTLGQTLDPMSEMSFLSSLDDVLSSYDSGIAKIWGAGESMVQNYATQFIPTLSSQLAATFDDTKRSTKASGTSGFEFGEETLNKIMYKIPLLRNTLEPTTDIWGNEYKQTENVLARGFESFLSPANKREGISTAVDDELKALYGEVGEAEVLPAIPYDYINYKGTKYDMSAEDYTKYKQTYGQTAYDLLEQLFNTDTYKYATSEEQADMVSRVYDYARDKAKYEYLAGQGVQYTNAKDDGNDVFTEDAIKGAIEADMTRDEYLFSQEYPEKHAIAKSVGGYEAYKVYQSELYDIKADKDEDGKSISGSRKEKVIDYINNLDADYGEKIILFKSEYPADDTYNYEIIDYLNGREDVSYEDMVYILKELGFTVDANGNIYWD